MYFSVQAQVVAERKAIWGSCAETWLCVRTEHTEWTSLSCLLALDYFKLSWIFKSARLKTCVNYQLLWQIHQLSRAVFTLAPGHRVVLIVQPLALIVIKRLKYFDDELSELSSRAFSQSGNNFSRAVLVMMLLTSVSEKQRTNISTNHLGMAPKSAFWFGSSTYRLHRYGHIGTGFR